MPDEGSVAVAEAPVVDAQPENSASESSQVTPKESTPKPDAPTDKIDGRHLADATKKFIAELKRQAQAELDPTVKAQKLDHAKKLFDSLGKADAYESVYPTVKEVREVRDLVNAVAATTGAKDWREGLTQMQARYTEAQDIDQRLHAGDPAVANKIWDEAPEGMVKVIPALVERFAKEKPQEFQKFISSHSIAHLDGSGFPAAFDRMAEFYKTGKTAEAEQIRAQLVDWVVGQRTAVQQQPKVDPEVERLKAELAKRDEGETSKQVDSAYNAVITAAVPSIDKVLKPIVAKLGLSPEQYNTLREHVWSDIQSKRNENPTYKTIAPAKQRQGYDQWTAYAKQWTDENAAESARTVANLYYGHQLKNGAPNQVKRDPVAAPGANPQIVAGQSPSPSEIDYGPKGIATAKRLGYKDLTDMIMAHQAPMKAGGVRKWA